MDDVTRVRAVLDPWARMIDFRLGVTRGGKQYMAQPIVLTEADETAFTQPFMRLSAGDAQALMDELWRCGLRPTDGTGSAGALAATERHLQDLQKLVFTKR